MTRKVAIVGSAPTCHEAPWKDDAWEIWTIGGMCNIAPRFDRLFEMHRLEDLLPDAKDAAEVESIHKELAWLKSNKAAEVWMRELDPDVPMAREYPIDAIVKEFGTYFTNTVSYMIALALQEGVDEIGIWGVHMEHMTEYADQRPSCEYFIGVAVGRGVPVYLPPASTLLACRQLYGEDLNHFTQDLKVRRVAIINAMNEQVNKQREAQLSAAKAEGALEILGYVQATYG